MEANNVPDAQLVAIGRQAGVTDELASCHTAKVGNYVVEGHVPAADIQRLLKEKPAIVAWFSVVVKAVLLRNQIPLKLTIKM